MFLFLGVEPTLKEDPGTQLSEWIWWDPVNVRYGHVDVKQEDVPPCDAFMDYCVMCYEACDVL